MANIKMYVALELYDHDGSEVIGVYDSRKKAQKQIDRHKTLYNSMGPDGFYIEEYELNHFIELPKE